MTNSFNNQGFDFFKNIMNPEFYFNSMKQAPVMDFSSFINAIKKNAETLSTTTQIAAKNMQSIVKKSAEIFQDNASGMFNVIKDTINAEDLEQTAANQQKYIKSAFENSINNAKEIMDMSTKSSMEIMEHIGNNVSENICKTFKNSKTER